MLAQWEETFLIEEIENGNFINNNEVKKLWIPHNKLVQKTCLEVTLLKTILFELLPMVSVQREKLGKIGSN